MEMGANLYTDPVLSSCTDDAIGTFWLYTIIVIPAPLLVHAIMQSVNHVALAHSIK